MGKNAPQQQKNELNINPFNFIFAQNRVSRKQGKDKKGRRPKAPPFELEDTEDALFDIANNGMFYPIEFVFDAILGGIENETSIRDQSGIHKVGLSSTFDFLSNPNGYLSKNIARNAAKRKWARIGGFLSGSIDGALFSLMAAKSGVPIEQAKLIGQIFAQDIGNNKIGGGDYLHLKEAKAKAIQQKGLKLISESLKTAVKNESKTVQKEISKLVSKPITLLELTNVESEIAKLSISKDKKDSLRSIAQKSLELEKTKPHEIESAVQHLALSLIAEKSPQNTQKLTETLEALKHNKRKTGGVRFVQALNTFKFIKKGIVDGEFTENLLKGDFDKLGLVERKKIKLTFDGSDSEDENEQFIEIWEAKDTMFGKLIGDMHYLHPRNLIRGLFIDGEIWLKMSIRNGTIDKKSFGYLMHKGVNKFGPKAIFKDFTQFAQKALFKFSNFIKSAFGLDKIKGLLTKILSNFLPAAIPGFGLLVDLILDWFDDAVSKFIMQVLAILTWGALGLLIVLMMMFDPGSMGYDPIANQPLSQDQIQTLDVSKMANPLSDSLNTQEILNGQFQNTTLQASKAFDPTKVEHVDPLDFEAIKSNNLLFDRLSSLSNPTGDLDIEVWNYDQSEMQLDLTEMTNGSNPTQDIFDMDITDEINKIENDNVASDDPSLSRENLPEIEDHSQANYSKIQSNTGFSEPLYLAEEPYSITSYIKNQSSVIQGMLYSSQNPEQTANYIEDKLTSKGYTVKTKRQSETYTIEGRDKANNRETTIIVMEQNNKTFVITEVINY